MAEQSTEKTEYLYGKRPHDSIFRSHATRTAEKHCQYMLPTLLKKAKDKPDLKLLDVGCGPGSITMSLARYIPKAEIVGVDASDAVVEKARQGASEQQAGNVKFITADVYSLPFEDGEFDVLHTHQAVSHFREHVRAIREMIRVTKKGGVICMREGIMPTASFYPPSPLLEETFRSVSAVLEKQDIVNDAGIRLRAWSMEAGIASEDIVVSAGTWCYSTAEDRQDFDGGRLFRGFTGDKAVQLGVLTRERIEEYEEAWKRWEEDEDGVFMLMQGEVIATVR